MKALACAAVLALGLGAPAQEPLLETTVGMRGRIEELPLPGPRLRARAVVDPQQADLVLRVIDVLPHGTEFRYTFEVMPLVAGRLDLRDHLEREDGSPVTDLPELPIRVGSLLPLGQVEPHELQPREPDAVGGYRTWMIALGALWLLGLLAILFVGRARRSPAAVEARCPVTLAERLRPLVERAQAGDLDSAGHAELERLILAYWRRRRNLQDVKAADAVAALRADPEAGGLLRALEAWLHSPRPARRSEIAPLLEPYRNVPASGEAS